MITLMPKLREQRNNYQMKRIIFSLLFLIVAAACSEFPFSSTKLPPSQALERGIASVYASSLQGRLTASGEPFNTDELTAAHQKLPFGTLLRVVNIGNDKEVVVRVNDRGPFVAGRIIDLSPLAANKLGVGQDGLMSVEIFSANLN